MPGDSEAKLTSASLTGADALILDLEDAVAPLRKAVARETVARWVRGDRSEGPTLWVRVNGGTGLDEDIRAVVTARLAGIVVPKCEAAAELVALDQQLLAAERQARLPPGSIAVAALLESAEGVLNARAIAAAPRVVRLQLGEADLCGELGLEPGEEEAELFPIRLQLVLASAAAGLPAPVGPVFRRVDDQPGLEASTRALRRLGFGGRSVVHPKQVQVVNDVFGPTEDELARARRIVDEFDRRVADGTGAYLDDHGMLVDQAVVRASRRLIQRAGKSGWPTGGR